MFIGERLRLAREAAGFSLRTLAEKAEISAQAISKYERNLDLPSSGVLIRLARSLGVKIEFFFRTPVSMEIVPVFRKKTSLTKTEENSVIARIREWLERYLAAENFLMPGEMFNPELPLADKGCLTLEQAEEKALELREAWGLGSDPISNLVDVLEDHGIKIGLIQGYEGFDACTFLVGDSPVIAMKEGLPGDRQRFNLAHELGHLALKSESEKLAHRFAGAFLVPRHAVFQELGKRRKALGIEELNLLKQKYGLSMQGWVYRAKDLGVISESTASGLFILFRTRGWSHLEPGDQLPSEKPKRMERLVFRALAEGLISEARAVELLGMSLPLVN